MENKTRVLPVTGPYGNLPITDSQISGMEDWARISENHELLGICGGALRPSMFGLSEVQALECRQEAAQAHRARFATELLREECGVAQRLGDERLERLVLVSEHSYPQISPQEYECGCITVTRVTDRDVRLGEKPFEMRLAISCTSDQCERVRLGDDTDGLGEL